MGKYSHLVEYKDIAAIVSPVPYVEPQPSLENIVAHQNVVNAARDPGPVLPVKFGVIFRNEEGVKTLLSSSHSLYKAKLDKFRGTDEYGVKVVLKTEGLKRLREDVGKKSKEISQMRKQLAKAKPGRAYLLKLKLDEAIKAESYRAIDKLSQQIHREIAKDARESSILKAEHDQIILNSAYLVNRKDGQTFKEQVKRLEKGYAATGLLLHLSGPWAPYSFVEGEEKR